MLVALSLVAVAAWCVWLYVNAEEEWTPLPPRRPEEVGSRCVRVIDPSLLHDWANDD